MGVVALHVAGRSPHSVALQILVVIVLIAVVYFTAREYFYWHHGK